MKDFPITIQNAHNSLVVLKGGQVIDGEKRTQTQSDVLIKDGYIIKIAPDIAAPNALEIDCKDCIVTAGFVDAHVHIESSMVLPYAFGEAVLPHGTTTVIADPHEIVNVAGASGLRRFLTDAQASPINIYTTVPSSVPATPFDTNGAGHFLAEDMKEFVNREDVVGLGEVMCYHDVIRHSPEIINKISLFRQKTIDGHTAGLSEDMLDAYISAGVQNDHECTDASAMLQRYRRGMNIYIREGSAARNARTLLECLIKEHLELGRFAFCTDDKHLATIAEEGHISYIVRMALQMGLTWGEVACMASYNPCTFYHLHKRGNMREGYVADIVVCNPDCSKIFLVLKDGTIKSRDGKFISSTNPEATVSMNYENTVYLKELSVDDFILPNHLKNMAIEFVEGQLLTHKVQLKANEWKDLTLLSTLERHGKNGNKAICLLKGYGIRNGAIATSVSHDSHNVICAGDNALDMAMACNRIRSLGGGYVIASHGRVVAELPLPAYGLMSTYSASRTASIIQKLENIAYSMGVNRKIDAFTTLSFVALPVIPSIRLLDTGIFEL